MLKTKIIWFSVGFASASAGVSLLVAKKLWASRETHSAELANKFGALEARVQHLEKDFLAKSSQPPTVGSN